MAHTVEAMNLAMEVGLDVGHLSARTLRATSESLKTAAIELNNKAINWPPAEWKEVADRVAWLTLMSVAYAVVADENERHDAAFT
jgi:hypothetical protein